MAEEKEFLDGYSGVWRNINGNDIFIRDGETLESAIKRCNPKLFKSLTIEELSNLSKQEIEDKPKFEEKELTDEEKSYQHIERVGREYNLSNKEIHAIHKYVNSFNDGWYEKVNKCLRDNIPLSKEDEAICKHLDLALDKIPKYQGNLLRVIDLKGEELEVFLNDHKKGKIVKYKSYTSTSSSKKPQVKGNIYIFIANAKQGADLREFNPIQKEILYKRDSRVYVNNVEKDNDIYKVYVSEV